MTEHFVKDPDAVLDYQWDWTDWLESDTISTVVITVPTGLTSSGNYKTTKKVTVWLSGGEVGHNYLVSCRITTVAGRVDERTIVIQCANL
jgi:hypothetical protein